MPLLPHKRFLARVAGAAITLAVVASASASPASMQLFLLAGQSNMAGRGKIADLTPDERAPDPRILALGRDGRWQPAVDPIHWDKPEAGVGLGKFFARILLEKKPDSTIGLIPTACGGSAITKWRPGEYWDQTKSHPWDDAIARARRAMQDGTLAGILWHQGESDSGMQSAALYAQRLTDLIGRFRRELDAPDLPFIMGEIGRFDAEGKPWGEGQRLLRDAQRTVADSVPGVYLVSSEGLGSIGDRVHFSTEAQRVLGTRYAEAYQRATSTDSP